MNAPRVALPAVSSFRPADVFRRVVERIPSVPSARTFDTTVPPPHGDHSLNPWDIPSDFLATTRLAAVLVGLVDNADEVGVLLTLRTQSLRDHAGQIAFPGGKVDADDASIADAALREAWEEVRLSASQAEVLGYMDPYLTRTGFRIVPVVARITPPLDLTINEAEVVEAFEVPFRFLMTEANHRLQHREWLGIVRAFYAMPYGERVIWGITAGILRVLYERLYA